MPRRDWDLNKPMYNYRSRNPNNLTVDYSTGADHRWPKWVTCGPLQSGVVLSTSGTEANTNAFALIPQASNPAIFWLYVAHGDKLDKLNWQDFSAATNQPAAVTERVTDLLVTVTPSGTRELSAFMEGTAYVVYPTITATNATDTVSTNNESKIIRVAIDGGDRIIGASGANIYGNVLTSTVTMDASSWQTLATLSESSVTPTGLAMSQGYLIWGTNYGPYMLNSRVNRFFPLLGKLPATNNNCRNMQFVEFLGVLIPLNTMLRVQDGPTGMRVGPERFGNPNPVQGTVTAIASDANYAYVFIDNPNAANVGGGTYVVAAKPGLDGLPEFYGMGYFAQDCEAAEVFGMHGVRSFNTLVYGLGSDLGFTTLGNLPVWPDDANYTYMNDTNQTIYGTDWYPAEPVNIDEICFELPSATTTQTVTAGIRGTTVRGQQFDQTILVANTSGLHKYPLPAGLKGPVVHYQPYFTLRTGSTSLTPKLTPQFYVMESPA